MQVVAEQPPVSAVTLESPLMLCTSETVRSVFAAGADPLDPAFRPGMLGSASPPREVDGVGVAPPADPPQPASRMIDATGSAATRVRLTVIESPRRLRQRSLRAESA